MHALEIDLELDVRGRGPVSHFIGISFGPVLEGARHCARDTQARRFHRNGDYIQAKERTMSVKREDLLAAAAVGVVQYTQVDPLLIFLLQRDVNLKREAMLRERRPVRMSGMHVMFYMLALLFIGVATTLIAIYTKLAINALGASGLLWFIGLYVLFTLLLAAWFERRQIGTATRIFATSVIALLPLAVFTSQQLTL